jgi:hypothetical protein
MISNARANRHRDATRQQFASSEVDLPLPGLIDQALILLGHRDGPDSEFLRLAEQCRPCRGFATPRSGPLGRTILDENRTFVGTRAFDVRSYSGLVRAARQRPKHPVPEIQGVHCRIA